MDAIATVTPVGRITLPKAVRETLGLVAGDRVHLRLYDDRVVLEKLPDFLELAGSVAVPASLEGASWDRIRSVTWESRSREIAEDDRA